MGSRGEHLKDMESPLTYHGERSCPEVQSECPESCVAAQPPSCLGIPPKAPLPIPLDASPRPSGWSGLQFSISSPSICSTPLILPLVSWPCSRPTHLGIQFLGFLSQLLLPHYFLLLLAGFILLFCFLRTVMVGVGSGGEAHTGCEGRG